MALPQGGPQTAGQTGGIINTGSIVTNGGHVIGGDVTINSPEAVVDALEARGLLQAAENAGLQRRVIVMLAQRLKPAERLDFERAITELERAVEIALDVIAHGERGSNEGAFVNAVLAEVAEKTSNSDLDGGSRAIASALAEIDRREMAQRETAQRERLALLDAAIRQHTLRRDAVAVAEQIERSVAVQHETELPAWHPDFLARLDEYLEEGEAKGINFSLEVAIECALRMRNAALGKAERNIAAISVGYALWRLGERDAGTERLLQAVETFRALLKECTREHMPLEWAMTQNNLGNALARLGERSNSNEYLFDAVEAYCNALEELTRERMPLRWAVTQNNLGLALWMLGERETGTGRLLEAVEALRDALKECTRERMPLLWADTQNNLGNALSALGERENGTERLLEAVEAYATRSKNRSASACRSNGQSHRTISAPRFPRLGNVRTALSVCSKPSRPTATRSRKRLASACRSTGR